MTTNFDTNIARAKAKGWKEGVRRMRMEKRMASGLVKACLARGYRITVNNGEDVPIRKSKSYRAVMDALWQTDEEHLYIYDDADTRQGWFFLVFGNDGWDLVADYSDNDACNEVWKTVLSPLSDKLCMEAVG
jgi:hypothetical protein